MNRNKSTVLTLACMVVGNAAWCAANDEAASPEALLSRARQQEEIWTEGTPPMSMRAEVQVLDARGALASGDYTFDWVSPSQWREVIRFRGYEQLRVGVAKGYWQKSGLSYRPEAIFLLSTILHLKEALSVGSKQTLGKVRRREKGGVRQQCTEVKWKANPDRTFCFDDASGALVSIEYPSGGGANPLGTDRVEYGAFKTVEGKLIPYEIRASRDRKIVASVKVLEIARSTESNPAAFTVPTNAELWPQCEDMRPAEPIGKMPPKYPDSAKAKHEQGRVVFYAVIESDGTLSHVAISQRAAPDLDAAAAGAISHWRYKPAACGQTPIRVETSIPVNFTLSQ